MVVILLDTSLILRRKFLENMIDAQIIDVDEWPKFNKIQ